MVCLFVCLYQCISDASFLTKSHWNVSTTKWPTSWPQWRVETKGFNLANLQWIQELKRTNKHGTVQVADTGLSCHAVMYVPKELNGISSKKLSGISSNRIFKDGLNPHEIQIQIQIFKTRNPKTTTLTHTKISFDWI